MILIFHSDSCNTNLHLVSLSVLFLELTLLLFYSSLVAEWVSLKLYIHSSTTTGIPGSTSGAQSQSQSSLSILLFFIPYSSVSIHTYCQWMLSACPPQRVLLASINQCSFIIGYVLRLVKSTQRITGYSHPKSYVILHHNKQESSMWQSFPSLTN